MCEKCQHMTKIKREYNSIMSSSNVVISWLMDIDVAIPFATYVDANGNG